MTTRRFEEGLRSLVYYAFGNIIYEGKLKGKSKKDLVFIIYDLLFIISPRNPRNPRLKKLII
jgi:hypothetical protein